MWTPQIAIIVPREPLPHLLFLLGPFVHHVMMSRNSFWLVPPEVSVDAWVSDAIVEEVDDVLLRDIRNGGMDIEKTACIGP
jgi:hypothetical protein